MGKTKVLIVAGGGGHFSPALAVIQDAPKNWEVLLVGRKYALEGDKALSYEYQTAKILGIPFVSLATGRWQRKFTTHTIPSLLKIPYGFFQGIKVIRTFHPEIVLSFGGYVSLPITLAAFFLRVPVVVHEQTLGAGFSNRIASFFAKKVCISWESSKRFFSKGKAERTGNPIRKEILEESQSALKRLKFDTETIKTVYITGGSLGSHRLNAAVEGCLPKLLEKYRVIHQTGDAQEYKDYQRLKSLRESFDTVRKERYVLEKFFPVDEVGVILRASDVVVARSGITTVCELLYLEKPSLFIPLPFAQNNEQMENALMAKKMGIGEILSQDSLSSEVLFSKISEIIENKARYQLVKKSTEKHMSKDAAENIIRIVTKVVTS